MKSLIQMLAAFVFASVFVLGAAEDAASYVRLEAGPTLQQDIRLNSINGLPAPGAKLSPELGARFDLVGGYSFNKFLAVEAEAGMLYNSFSSLKGSPVGLNVEALDLWQVPLLANVVLTIPLHSRLKPYLGVGGGGLWSMLDTGGIRNEEDFALAYQGQAGVNYFITERMEIGLGYKFLGSLDHNWGVVKTKETYNHSLLLQFTFEY